MIDCAQRSGLRSQTGDVPTQITFYNARTDTVTVQWVDYDGALQVYTTLAGGEQYTQDTFVTHPWLISDGSGACRAIYTAVEFHGAAVIR